MEMLAARVEHPFEGEGILLSEQSRSKPSTSNQRTEPHKPGRVFAAFERQSKNR